MNKKQLIVVWMRKMNTKQIIVTWVTTTLFVIGTFAFIFLLNHNNVEIKSRRAELNSLTQIHQRDLGFWKIYIDGGTKFDKYMKDLDKQNDEIDTKSEALGTWTYWRKCLILIFSLSVFMIVSFSGLLVYVLTDKK